MAAWLGTPSLKAWPAGGPLRSCQVLLASSQVCHQHAQAPRGAGAGHSPVGEPLLGQIAANQVLQLGEGQTGKIRRQLLGADLQ